MGLRRHGSFRNGNVSSVDGFLTTDGGGGNGNWDSLFNTLVTEQEVIVTTEVGALVRFQLGRQWMKVDSTP